MTKKSGHSVAVYSTFKHQFDHYLRPKHKTPNSIFNIWAVDTLWYIEATGLVETQWTRFLSNFTIYLDMKTQKKTYIAKTGHYLIICMTKYHFNLFYKHYKPKIAVSLVDNAPNYLVGCIIQKRWPKIAVFLYILAYCCLFWSRKRCQI